MQVFFSDFSITQVASTCHVALSSFVYVDNNLFLSGNFRTGLSSFHSVFIASLAITSHTPSFILCVALASGGAALSLVPHGGLWRFLPHLCWANTLVCL